jgi:hypothetical protein
MLAVQLQIGFRDVIRVSHIVVDGHSRAPLPWAQSSMAR